MRFRKPVVLLILLGASMFLMPAQALACACCAEPNEHRIGYAKPTSYELSLLKQMRFDKTASIFLTAEDFEVNSAGISKAVETYSLTASMVGNLWKLEFRNGKDSGTLTLPLPARMSSFSVDIHDKESDIAEPLLYKEWRFEAPVKGTGIFSGGINSQTKYFLVLQGRGNNCDNASDFTHWRLAVFGKKAKYAFYGKLTKPSE